MTMPSVLVMSASAGNGHVSAGNALAEAIRAAGFADVTHHDVLELAPAWVRSAYGGGFGLIASRAPRLWREVYEISDGPSGDPARWGRVAQGLLFREFERLLRSRSWSVCVCTHFLPGQLAAGRAGLPPFASVITDFTLHRYWVQPRVGTYYAPTIELTRALHERLPRAAAIATGIPIAREFARAPSAESARRALGLPAAGRVILVMGGGLGLGLDEAVDSAMDAVPGGIVIAVCGRNTAAADRLRARRADRLRVTGYTSDIAPLMSAADVVVTKPGGLTCSEALACGRPLVLSRALPGHEEGNMRYLTQRGAAIDASDAPALREALRCLFASPTNLARAAAAAAAAGMPHAARSIASSLERRFVHRRVA